MRRLSYLFLGAALAAGAVACGGGSEDAAETPAPLATPTRAAATATPANAGLTPVSAASTPSATPAVETPAAAATEAPTAAPTQAANPTPVTTAPPPPPAPTATPAPSANPLSATIGSRASGASYLWTASSVTVAPGATVTWSWNDTVPHNVVGSNFALGPTAFANQLSTSFTFAAPGTYSFRCEVHPTMTGKVIVQ